MCSSARLRSTVIVFAFLCCTLITTEVQANCRGCCSHHGGVTCEAGVTKCRDGTELSVKCSSKGCNKCGSTTKPKQRSSESQIKSYDRKLYRHWVDADGDCQTTRHEVLVSTSLVRPKFKTEKNCIVVSGKWYDVYTDQYIYDAQQLDIDHLIPLGHAHKHGAAAWSKERKEQFANDFENLIAVSARENRKKGARPPTEWLPPNKKFHCQYLNRWTSVYNKYGLTELKRRPASISSMMESVCKDPNAELLKQTKPESP